MPLTPPGKTRQKVFEFVRRCITEGSPPTVREVQSHLGFRAVQTARQHLEKLVAEGRLVKTPGQSRGYRLPPEKNVPGPLRLVPLLGQVQAGALHEAIEDPDGYISVEDSAAEAEIFALTVKGESMIGAGILPDDIVIVHSQKTARDNEIVVAQVGDEATVKRLRLCNGQVELHPENPAFAPIVIKPDAEVRILGRVVEIRRRLF